MKKILALSLLGWMAFAQQRQTVYTQLWNAITTLPGTKTSLIQNNQGQTFHTITVTTVNSGGTCNPNAGFALGSNFSGELEASSDSVNYVAIPQRASNGIDVINSSQVKIYRATTAYPFVRFKILDFPSSLPANCAISIFYSGSLTASNLSDSVYNTGQNNFGFAESSITTSCGPLSNTAANSGAGINNTIGLTGILISNPNAAASTVTFYNQSAAAACGTGNLTLSLTVPANGSLTITPDSFLDPLLISPSRGGIYIKSSAGTLTANSYLIYEN